MMALSSLKALPLNLLLVVSVVTAFVTSPSHHHVVSHGSLDTRRHFDIGSMISNFGKKVTVSHILIGPATSKTGRGMEQDVAIAKLEELKQEINNDPVKFAEVAAEYSSCASCKKGGDLGEFGPGLLTKPIDEICFQEPVGVVHGPVSTMYGEHLVLVRERTGDDKRAT